MNYNDYLEKVCLNYSKSEFNENLKATIFMKKSLK